MYITDDKIRQNRKSEITRIKYIISQGYSLLITGKQGSGKSTLARIVEEEFKNEGFTVAYVKERTEKNIYLELADDLDVSNRDLETGRKLKKGELKIALENNLTNKSGVIIIIDNIQTVRPHVRRWFGDQRYRKVQLILFGNNTPKTDIFTSVNHITLNPFDQQAEDEQSINLSNLNWRVIVQWVGGLIALAALMAAQNNPSLNNYSENNITTTPVYPQESAIEPEYKPEPHQKKTVPDNPIISISVDDPSHVQIEELSDIKKGDIIADDSEKRNSLTKELKSIESKIINLNNKLIAKSLPPKKAPSWKAMESHKLVLDIEKKSFYQLKLKLKQALSTEDSQISQLNSEKARLKKEVEKTKAELQLSKDTISERRDFIESIKDDYIDPPILPSEKASLQILIEKNEQIKSSLKEQQARLDTVADEYRKKLLHKFSNLTSKGQELYLAELKLSEIQREHEQLEDDALTDEKKRLEQQKQSQEKYDYDVRNRKYQLKALNSRLSEINNELNKMPVFRSPSDGYVTKITTGYLYGGKYLVEVTIKP